LIGVYPWSSVLISVAALKIIGLAVENELIIPVTIMSTPHLQNPMTRRAPGSSKGVSFRMDIYGSILCLFDVFNTTSASSKGKASDQEQMRSSHILSQMTRRERSREEAWSRIFPAMTAQVVATITSDISYAPDSLKVACAWVVQHILNL